MALSRRLTSFFTFPRLLVLLLLLQALFLFQLSIIWNVQGQLRQRQASLRQAQEAQEEEIMTPGMLRGL